MAKKTVLVLITCLAVMSVWPGAADWSQAIDSRELEQKLREAEGRYSEEEYSRAREILIDLSRSFPSDRRFSYFQFMIAKCDYHLGEHASARERFEDFIRRFPQSSFMPACHFMLGNVAYLEGARLKSAGSFVQAYETATADRLRRLAQRSLEPLLGRWLSEDELEKLGRANQGKKLASKIWFWLGRRQLERGGFAEASATLSFYRNNFPDGEEFEQVGLMLEEASSSSAKSVKVGVLAPFTGDFSVYGNSLLNGIKLALSVFPPSQRSIELEIRDTKGDFVEAARLCRELSEKEGVVCVIGPLRSEAVAAAAVEAEHSKIPLITPTASKRGLATLGDFIFQLSPAPDRKGKVLAESAVRDEDLREFVMLLPEAAERESEAAGFKETVEGLGGSILTVELYAADTRDFSSHLRRIKSTLLGFSPSTPGQEEASFFDEIPVWVDGLFISAEEKGIYDILSRIAYLNILGTIIGTEACGSEQVVEFANNIDREMIFVSNGLDQDETAQRKHFSDLYRGQYDKEADLVSMRGYDCMVLLLSIMEQTASPQGIGKALARISDFVGVSGEIHFSPEGENVIVPVYKLEREGVRRLR